MLCSRILRKNPGTLIAWKYTMNTDKTTTIRGIVIAADWDDNGTILRLAILTYEENRIMVVPNDQGMELISFLRKSVQVNGILRQKENTMEIEVHTFAIDIPQWESSRKK